MAILLTTRILKTSILSILLYGKQTWTLTKHKAVKVANHTKTMKRSPLGINKKDKIKNEVIKRETQIKDVIYIAKQLITKICRQYGTIQK